MQGAPPASNRLPLPGTAPTRTAQLGDATATGPAARVSVRAHVDIADASTWLVLLLLGDLAFIAIHGLWLALPGIEGRVYALDYDRGHAEFYQYTKALWIVALLAALTVRSRARGYLAWMAVFALLLVDDAMAAHERLGARLGNALPSIGFAGLRPHDVGEAVVAAAMGALVLGLLARSWRRGDAAFRHASGRLVLLLLALLFFGVGIDLLHALARFDAALGPWLLIVEDGGEMLTLSVIVWYVFLLHKSDGDFAAPLARTLAAAGRHARALLAPPSR